MISSLSRKKTLKFNDLLGSGGCVGRRAKRFCEMQMRPENDELFDRDWSRLGKLKFHWSDEKYARFLRCAPTRARLSSSRQNGKTILHLSIKKFMSSNKTSVHSGNFTIFFSSQFTKTNLVERATVPPTRGLPPFIEMCERHSCVQRSFFL